MTESEVRAKIVGIAQSYIGCKESDGSHRKIIDAYNSHKPLARGYKVKYTDAWCATFASFCAIKAGFTDIIPLECGCPDQIELFRKKGRWQENDAYVPKPGDYIYYDWEDSGVGDNKGTPNHVGIVEKVVGNKITVIEGNYSDSVKRRTISVNGKSIRGYGVPDYASKATAAEKESNGVGQSSSAKPSGSSAVSVGDTVKIQAGSTYATGKEVPGWVVAKKWIVKSVDGSTAVIDKSADGANAINSPINVRYLTVVQGASSSKGFEPYMVKVTANSLNVRKGAGTTYGVAGTIRDGGSYTIVDEADGQGASKWGKLRSGQGWVSLDYCKKI